MSDERSPQELEELAGLLRDRVDPQVRLHGGAAFDQFVGDMQHSDEGTFCDLPGTSRWQDRVIVEQIPTGARVLDLGCGSGELLASLREHKQVRGQGVELQLDQVAACVARGVPVFQADLDDGLRGFADESFDYVVLEETLQTLHKPAVILHEMLRVGRCGIVSFPNFGHWRIRLYLAARGRMPVSRRLPHQWHDTPNIHNLTDRDFRAWCAEHELRIERSFVLRDGQVMPYEDGDNLNASEVLCFVRRDRAITD